MTPAQRYAAAWEAHSQGIPQAPLSFVRPYASAHVDTQGRLHLSGDLKHEDIPAFIAWLRATFEEPAP